MNEALTNNLFSPSGVYDAANAAPGAGGQRTSGVEPHDTLQHDTLLHDTLLHDA